MQLLWPGRLGVRSCSYMAIFRHASGRTSARNSAIEEISNCSGIELGKVDT